MHKCAVCPKSIPEKRTTCSSKCRQKLHRQKEKAIAIKYVPEKMKCTECSKSYLKAELGWSAMFPEVHICEKCVATLYANAVREPKKYFYKYQGVDFGFRNNRKIMGNAGVRPRAGRPTG